MENGEFICCEKCGKKIIKKLSDGMLEFKFGKSKRNGAVVQMKIAGVIIMKCLRDDCKQQNTISSELTEEV